MPLPPETVAVGSWTFDPVVAGVLAIVGAAYLLGVRHARRRGGWPLWRVLSFLVLGLGGVVVCTMSSLALYDRVHLWALAVQLTLLLALVPVPLALGDPVGLARASLGARGRQRLEGILEGPVVRVLTFPVVAAVLATAFTVAVFFTGVLGEALRHAQVMNGLYLAALVVGCLAALPMLGAEILPEWCTEPFRLLFAFTDGLVDAIPGVLVMTTGTRLAGGWFAGRAGDPNWDVHLAGAAMLSLSELVALPVFFIVLFRWASREGAFAPREVAPRAQTAVGGGRAPSPEPELMRPWWETDDRRAPQPRSRDE